jgi:preprotein translocase subunit SecG
MWISPLDNSVIRAIVLGSSIFYCKYAGSVIQSSTRYSTVLEVWNVSINIFILVAIIEFVIVLGISSAKQENLTPSNRWARGIDMFMRIVYPIALIVFVVVCLIMVNSGNDDDDKED